MAIELDREVQLEQEKREQERREQERLRQLEDAQAQESSVATAQRIASQVRVVARVGQAAHLGFTGGFSEELGGSALGALSQIAEAAEAGSAAPVDLDERMARFPELRDVELATGNAARFPELAEESSQPKTREASQDDDLER
ncbi:MAG: hypothetical protein ABWX92_04520 [Mycetocola sp.]